MNWFVLDDVAEEIAVLCKTLKPSTDRSHFEKFIREALVFHNVPQHLNLAQVRVSSSVITSKPYHSRSPPPQLTAASRIPTLSKTFLSLPIVILALESSKSSFTPVEAFPRWASQAMQAPQTNEAEDRGPTLQTKHYALTT
jgi:hypothetical protein